MPSKPSLRMRSWGTRFDTLPSSPPTSPPARDSAEGPADASEPHATDPAPKRKDEKMPHDASVFVGSLPSNIDQQELTRLLSDHLSEHTEVKNIKVVRDSKGGVCAFVQCEDAASAASLINTLHSNTPKQFLGRTLRYEPARAFRTLLISYRTPMQFPPNNLDPSPKPVELNLPTAMRVWRPKNSKFYSLLYNTEAIDTENYARNNPAVASDKPSLFLQPLMFDAETINTIASYFGPLENIHPLQLIKDVIDVGHNDVIEDWKLYPSPHNAPRSAKMDTACWEIKWEHRDDCVSALMTLRRVPHLTVTWAHQPPPFASEHRSPYMPFPHVNLAQYPLHVQNQMQLTRARTASSTDPFGFSRALIKAGEPSKSSSECGTTSDTGSENDMAYSEDSLGDATSVRWSDMDFPPLGNTRRLLKAGSGVWSECQPDSGRGRSASLTLSQKEVVSYSMSEISLEDEKADQDQSHELDIPSTPSLGRSPLTPKTPGFPPTPKIAYSAMQNLSLRDNETKDSGYLGDAASRERDIDPTTLFVGGLETFGPGAWDEEKVTKFFARFGGLEEVKIVRPLNSHAAFAFVKFNNTEAPARAVFEEHNRVYEGRAMRVQLRDCNPPRGSWRHNRGRSHFHQQKFGPHRRAQEDQERLSERTGSRNSRIQDSQNQTPRSSQEDKTAAEAEPSVETGPPVYTEIASSKVPGETTEDDEAAPASSTEATVSSSGPSTPFTSISTQPSENYREWYDEPLSTTPSLSASINSSVSMPTSTPAIPYSVPGTYFTPTPWIQPYGQPMPFPMPYVGFPGYSLPGQPQMPPQFPRPPGSDGNVPAVSATWPPMGMYGSFIPYQAPPPRTPTVDPSPSQPTPTLNNKAPLYPTGFIQNEQGTLIAVYQPEALDQYMAGAPAAPLPQHPVQNMPNWNPNPYSQPAGYPTPGPPPTAAMPGRQTLPSTNMAWIPNQGFASQQQPHIQQTPHLTGPAAALRGGYPDLNSGQTGGPPFRRHPGRRDQGGPQNNHTRNSQPRSFQNRNGRGNIPMNNGYHNGDVQSGLRSSHLTVNEWNQWGATVPR
ncbi:hypothetical protein J132_05329 [Termitomyces sp. J132]|nr:hypothetical protein J132_05329 [Termitomyces sp. J132]